MRTIIYVRFSIRFFNRKDLGLKYKKIRFTKSCDIQYVVFLFPFTYFIDKCIECVFWSQGAASNPTRLSVRRWSRRQMRPFSKSGLERDPEYCNKISQSFVTISQQLNGLEREQNLYIIKLTTKTCPVEKN